MAIAEDKLYDELGKFWMYFASWREKLLAGYASVLAGLGLAFWKIGNPKIRAALFALTILVSVVFRIIDYRTNDLIIVCKNAGERLAGDPRGYYGLHNEGRFKTSGQASYGLAIDLLVSGVFGASAIAFIIYMRKWCGYPDVAWWWSLIAAAACLAVFLPLRCRTKRLWSEDKSAYASRANQA